MSTMETRAAGFDDRADRAMAFRRGPVAVIELITTAALALSTVVAVTAVSIGIARAESVNTVAGDDGAALAIALFIGLLLSGMGGLTAVMAADRTRNA
jgi:hypothetical protein